MVDWSVIVRDNELGSTLINNANLIEEYGISRVNFHDSS